jgi:hypothetical protein
MLFWGFLRLNDLHLALGIPHAIAPVSGVQIPSCKREDDLEALGISHAAVPVSGFGGFPMQQYLYLAYRSLPTSGTKRLRYQ